MHGGLSERPVNNNPAGKGASKLKIRHFCLNFYIMIIFHSHFCRTIVFVVVVVWIKNKGSSYHNFTFIATNPIEAGQEIFTDYSTSWFADKDFDDDESNSVPKQPDYDYVDQLVKKLVEFHNKHDLSEAAFQNVVFRVKNEMIPSGAGGDRRKKLIPDTIEELEKVADIGKRHVFFILQFLIIFSISNN